MLWLSNYKKIEVDDFILHITPKENLESIKAHGLLIPSKVDRNNHTSPYDKFNSSRVYKHDSLRARKDKYTRFGRLGKMPETFRIWFEDPTCVNGNIAFTHRNFLSGLTFPFYDNENNNDTFRTGYTIPFKDLVQVEIINYKINKDFIPSAEYVILLNSTEVCILNKTIVVFKKETK